MQQSTYIDLFCGCGGFSLGMERAGFKGLAAIDFNKEAIQVFKTNFPQIPHILDADLTKFAPEDLAAILKTRFVDIIVGGPPCQGFSVVRQADGSNNGQRIVADPRRQLYKEFFKFVSFFRPKIFIMENVLGIRSAEGGAYYIKVQEEARSLGYRISPRIEEAIKLGVPQKRRRQLFIGTRSDLPVYFTESIKAVKRASAHPTLGAAIMDLPKLAAGGGLEETKYNLARRAKFLKTYDGHYLFDVLEVDKAKTLTAHRARPHSDRDIRDFRLLREGENSKDAMDRGVLFNFPYDKTSFKDRFTRQSRHKPCSTIVAHMSRDGLMFIHPKQDRSLTPREAARVQSFPDWFLFPVARTSQFKMIGNAVPPLIGEAVGNAIKSFIQKCSNTTPKAAKILPTSTTEQLEKLDNQTFLQIWNNTLLANPNLHPDGAIEPKQSIAIDPNGVAYLSQSGWPVDSQKIAKEAHRRYTNRKITSEELYPALQGSIESTS